MFKRKSGTLTKKQAAQQREQRKRAESTQAAPSDNNNDDSDQCCVICMDKEVEQQRQLGQVFLSHSMSLNSFLSLK